MKINFKVSRSVQQTREADSDDDWDRGDTYTDWHVDNVLYFADTNERYDYDRYNLETKINIAPGQTYYVVYAIYSTGDTFGHDACGCLEFIDIFTSRQFAEDAAKILEEDDVAGYLDEFGNEFTIRRPWLGYFESLDEIRVEAFIADGKQ